MTRSRDITSFTDFRSRLRDHLDQSKATNRPLFITSNGETEAVVLSPAAFDDLIDQAEFARSLRLLDRSRDDIQSGRTRRAKPALRKLAKQMKLNLDR